jgi:ribosomal protein S4
MSLRSYFVVRLETMLNIILFRMNLFSNTYFANNFVKVGGVFINNKNVRYPYRFMNFNDILMINKRFFKKIFNSFFKKLSLSRVLLKKRNKFYIYCKLNRPKLILNAPKYLQINYKILHAILWRLPRKKEIVGPYSHPVTSIHE